MIMPADSVSLFRIKVICWVAIASPANKDSYATTAEKCVPIETVSGAQNPKSFCIIKQSECPEVDST